MNNKKTLVVIGAGGHGKVVADCARALGHFSDIKFLDAAFPELKTVVSWDVVAHQDDYLSYHDEFTWFFVAIGNNATRSKWQQTLINDGLKLATLVHPKASAGEGVTIGQGTLILAGAVVNTSTEIGEGCIINTGATVDHDCLLGAYSHVAPGVNLAGTVNLEREVFIGVGASVIPGIVIGEKSVVGAGATVLSDLPKQVTAVGCPAKVIKSNRKN